MQVGHAVQQRAACQPHRKLRPAPERRLARLVQVGIRRARYVGRLKTLFQLLLAATVANWTLVATKTGLMKGQKGQGTPVSCL